MEEGHFTIIKQKTICRHLIKLLSAYSNYSITVDKLLRDFSTSVNDRESRKKKPVKIQKIGKTVSTNWIYTSLSKQYHQKQENANFFQLHMGNLLRQTVYGTIKQVSIIPKIEIFGVYFLTTVVFFVAVVQLIYNIVLVSGIEYSDSIFSQIIFHLKLLQNNSYISLCCVIYLFCLFILYIVVCIS